MPFRLQMIDSVSVAASINEDRFGHAGTLCWMLDGASPVGGHRVTERGSSDAEWLVDLWNEFLPGMAASTLSLESILLKGIEMLTQQAALQWTSTPDVEPSSTLALVRIGQASTEYLVVGDSPAVFLYDGHETVVLDNRPDETNGHILEAVLADCRAGLPFDEAKKRHLVELAEHRRRRMNQPGGYDVIARNLFDTSSILTGSLPTPDRILLASDGFARAVEVFRISPDYQTLLLGSTLAEVADQVRKAESIDPNCLSGPRWSKSDDCSAALFKIVR